MQVVVRSDIPVSSTWDLLKDVGEWHTFMGLFPESEILEADGLSKQVKFVVAPPWPIKQFTCVVQARERPEVRLIEWRVQEGKLKGNFGILSVEPFEGGSKIIYESTGPTRNAFPTWAVRIGVRIVLPGVLKDFYRKASASKNTHGGQ